MKKVVFGIVIILILISIVLILMNIYNYSQTEINSELTISKEEIHEFNLLFEKFYGINESKDIKKLLKKCIDNYIKYYEEPLKVPIVKFIAEKNELILEYELSKDYYKSPKKETEYYKGLNNILENILSDKTYKVDLEEVPYVRKIEITECDEKPKKFDIKEMNK